MVRLRLCLLIETPLFSRPAGEGFRFALRLRPPDSRDRQVDLVAKETEVFRQNSDNRDRILIENIFLPMMFGSLLKCASRGDV